MNGLKKVQTQLLDEATGEVLEDVNVMSDAECITYSNPEKTIAAHGGIPAGTSFDNVPLNQVLDDILYPYTKPTVSLSANPNGAVREKGTSLTPIALTANVGKKSANIQAVEFFKGTEKSVLLKLRRLPVVQKRLAMLDRLQRIASLVQRLPM